jgi:hypothetical protein
MRRPLALAASAWLLAAAAASAAPPPPHECPTISGPIGPEVGDAVARKLREGEQLAHSDLLALRSLLPPEIWQNRHVFFFPGMKMVIGDCHRVYATPEFYRAASEAHAGEARIDAENNLENYTAGLPFPPESIDLESPGAGAKWAWNLERRFRGAGPFGNFRLVDIHRSGSDHVYEGFFFFLQTMFRTDLGEANLTVSDSSGSQWIAGGRFAEPTSARHLAWRQMRPIEAQQRFSASDDTFVYVPTQRKVRRGATPWVDGVYLPRYTVAGDSGGGGINIGADSYGGGGLAINPTSALSIQQTEHIDRGFTALALRPNAYIWRVHGEREVLAPLNSARPGYPNAENRNFGPHGLSVASDRWDVRWATVIEGRALRSGLDHETLVLYLDWQTQQPLYAITRASRGRILNVGIPVHRYSDDTVNYPGWPTGERASVFDPVAEVFYRVADDSGWRRESYNMRSTPADDRERRRFTSTSFLVRGH